MARDYDDLLRLAAAVEAAGGYLRAGNDIHVGEEVVTGRDVVELLIVVARRAGYRACEKEGHKSGENASYVQGYDDAKREARRAVNAALTGLRDP